MLSRLLHDLPYNKDEMASTVPLPGRKPYWLSLAKVSICSWILFRINLQKTFPGMQFSVMVLWFSAINLSPLWVGMNRSFDQSVGVLSSLHILFIILCSICSIAGPPFFITSAVILSCPGAFLIRSRATTSLTSQQWCQHHPPRYLYRFQQLKCLLLAGNSLLRCCWKCSFHTVITSSSPLTMFPCWSFIAFSGRFRFSSSSLTNLNRLWLLFCLRSFFICSTLCSRFLRDKCAFYNYLNNIFDS